MRQQAWAKLLELVGRDYLARFNKRLPRDLQAKWDAADVVQDALVLACDDIDQFQGVTDETLLHWLRSVCRHRRQNLDRRYRRSGKRQIGREVPLDNAWSCDRRAREPAAQTLDPAALAIAHEDQAHARDVLARLTPAEREIISLKLGEGLKFVEAGERLGLTEAAAQKRYRRAVEHFTQLLKESAGR